MADHDAFASSPVGERPSPTGVRTLAELVMRLGQLRVWSGLGYREVHRRVVAMRRRRGVPELPSFDTVYRCMRPGRSRLDVELVVDIAQVLLGEEEAALPWRMALRALGGRASAAGIVRVYTALPDDHPGFTGRQAELQRLLEGLTLDRAQAAPPVGVVEGMAGVGKTTLIVHAGHQLLRRGLGTDLQLGVDLRGYDRQLPPADPAAVLEGFLRMLGVPGDQVHGLDLAGRAEWYRRLLAGRRTLIVLDNAASEEQVKPLLPRTADCLTLVSSRNTLSNLPGARRLPLEVLTESEALDLLRTTIGPDRVDADPYMAASIVRMVGYLPLALGVVAGRINNSPQWTLADQLARLAERHQLRQLDSVIEFALDLSYQALAPDMQRMIRLLALHVGDDLDAYAAAALAGCDLPTATRRLDHLVAANLLQRGTPARYHFHDLMQIYAGARAIDDEPDSARRTALTRLSDSYRHTSSQVIALLYPDIEALITDLVTASGSTAAAVAARVATETERPTALVNALIVIADQPAMNDIDLLAAISAVIPRYTYAEFAAQLAGRIVALRRDQTHTQPDTFEPELAASLNDLSVRLNTLWRFDEALAASEEATIIYRRVAAARPDKFEPDLAKSLNHLAFPLSQLRRRDDALAANKEAAAIYRRVAATRPDEFEPELARSLFRLSVSLGPGEDGLLALEEATALYRRLAAARPDAFEPELARSLSNVYVYLSGTADRRGEAATAIEECTSIYQRLAANLPGSFRSQLAQAQTFLSRQLAELGHTQEALTSIEEATSIYRHQATTISDLFEYDLGRSLIHQSARLDRLGRHRDALAALEEATTIFRRPAAWPRPSEPMLAVALNRLSLCRTDLGRHEEALAASQEATTIYRRFATNVPNQIDPELGDSLNNLSLCLADLGRHEDALTASQEATGVYRRLVAAQPAYVVAMARTLNNLSPRLADLGRHEEALSTSEEAVAGYRHLVATRNAFRRELAASLNNLSLCLSELGRREDAMAAIEEATTILWQLGRTRPNAIVPDLATSLWALAWVHDKFDLATEAAAVAVRQAVGVYERLPATRTDVSRRLPSAAQTLARMLDRLGHADEASAVRARYGLDPDASALRPSIGLREFRW